VADTKAFSKAGSKGGGEKTIAVALDYDPSVSGLPRVVASGKGALAEQILAIAFANGVKVREDADLVQILSLLEVDSEIPLPALAAVAEILAYVYRSSGRPMPKPPAEGTEA
jgi:flagellar biosynthesis protein